MNRFAVCAVAAVLAAASPADALENENLLVALPDGYKVGYQKSAGKQVISETVIVKTDNAFDHTLTCKVDCQFTSPQGPATISRTQTIPANSKGWYVCLRPSRGNALEFAGGSESCK